MASRRVWLIALPLLAAATEGAHWLAFRLAYPNAFERAQALASGGHGELAYWPPAAGAALALLLGGFAVRARDHARTGDGPLAPPAALVAALPPLAFALQEHLEALVHSGGIAGVADSPTFLLGVALELPAALLVYLLARMLERAAVLVGAAFRPARPRLRPAAPLVRRASSGAAPRLRLRRGTAPSRAPPLPA